MRTFAMVMVAVVLAIFPAAAKDKKPLPTEPFSGKAWAVDGDTINMTVKGFGDVRVRLWGVDAPEMKNWPWGQRARGVMDDLIDGKPVRCVPTGQTTYNRPVAKCTNHLNADLSAAMIASGYAVEYRTFSRGALADHERIAREAKRGVWKD